MQEIKIEDVLLFIIKNRNKPEIIDKINSASFPFSSGFKLKNKDNNKGEKIVFNI